jgi:hypothetical protein
MAGECWIHEFERVHVAMLGGAWPGWTYEFIEIKNLYRIHPSEQYAG